MLPRWLTVGPPGALLLAGLALASPGPRDGSTAGSDHLTPDAIGPEACRTCHPEEYAEWLASPHGRTGRALAEPEGGADLAIGSSWMQGFLRRDESGFHRLLPRSWDIEGEHWRATDEVLDAIQGPLLPGEERGPRQTERRSFERDCSGCHVSGTRLREDPADGHLRGGWRSTSIDCESCHGPARAHVEAWRAMDDGQPLVDLARFDARAASAVCARCHGGAPVGSDFRPEDAPHWIAPPLVGPGTWAHGAASGQIYQADAFLRSACHVEGGLACGDCHTAHGNELRHTEHADALCTRCHSGYTSEEHTHHAASNDGARCVGCHMPTLLDGLLAHQRDHRIGSPVPAAPEAPDACTACHDDKDKAWAAEHAERWWGPPAQLTLDAIRGIQLARLAREEDAAEVRALLERAVAHPQPFFRWAAATYLGDPAGLADEELPEGRLLALQLATPHPEGKAPLRAGLRDPSPTLRAKAYAALIARGQTRREPPVEDLAVAARVNRVAAEERVLLARAWIAAGQRAEAIDLLEETVVFRRREADPWLVLAAAYGLEGRADSSRAAVRRWSELPDAAARLDALLAQLLRTGERALGLALLDAVEASGAESGNADLGSSLRRYRRKLSQGDPR